MQNNKKDPTGVKRYLHPTKGWRKGMPRFSTRGCAAIELNDGTIHHEVSKKKRLRRLGGIFTYGNGFKQRIIDQVLKGREDVKTDTNA